VVAGFLLLALAGAGGAFYTFRGGVPPIVAGWWTAVVRWFTPLVTWFTSR